MRHINVNVNVGAPAKFVLAYAYSFFSERERDGGHPTLALNVPAPAGTITADVPVRVRVHYQSGKAPGGSGILIAWQADEHVTSFPSFRGTLKTIVAGESACILSLSGFYSPPGGPAGAAFDALLGVRIAHATIEKLLRDIAERAARDYETRIAL